jgi:hypothetical protein
VRKVERGRAFLDIEGKRLGTRIPPAVWELDEFIYRIFARWHRSSRGVASGVQYYDIQRRWRRIRPHLGDPELQRILVRDIRKVSPRFRPGMKPAELDDCDRRFFDCEGDLRRRDLKSPFRRPCPHGPI